MTIRETRVFIPATGVFARPNPWPNIFGYVVRPLVEHGTAWNWHWFSRYAQPVDHSDHADCDPRNFPPQFYWTVAFDEGKRQEQWLFSFRLRYAIPSDSCEPFEARANEIISGQGCIPRFFRQWTSDLGGSRFTDLEDRREKRAQIVLRMIQSSSELVLHSLIEPSTAGGDYAFEPKAFCVPHHLVSNITMMRG